MKTVFKSNRKWALAAGLMAAAVLSLPPSLLSNLVLHLEVRNGEVTALYARHPSSQIQLERATDLAHWEFAESIDTVTKTETLMELVSAKVPTYGASQMFFRLRTGPPTQSVKLAWDAVPDPTVTGYRLHYRKEGEAFQWHVDVGNVTQAALDLPAEGDKKFVLSVSCYTGAGFESDSSQELQVSL